MQSSAAAKELPLPLPLSLSAAGYYVIGVLVVLIHVSGHFMRFSSALEDERGRSDVCHFSIWAESIKFFMIIPLSPPPALVCSAASWVGGHSWRVVCRHRLPLRRSIVISYCINAVGRRRRLLRRGRHIL